MLDKQYKSAKRGAVMSKENTIIINGQELSFEPGETILDVATRNGIYIPTLCYLRRATPTGACRICVVEVEGSKDLVPACSTPASAGMKIKTDSPRVIEERRAILEQLLSSGTHNCLVQDLDQKEWTDFQLKSMEIKEHEQICPAYGECRLQDLAIRYRVKPRVRPKESKYPPEENPFFIRDFSRCIRCGRCAQACNEIQVNDAISFSYKEADSSGAKEDYPLTNEDCVFCGECVQVCPVGALVPKSVIINKVLPNEVKKVRTTCSYCGVGCQIYLHVKDNKVVKVTGVEEVAPNYGSLCVKGRFGYEFINHPDRLKKPLIKENGKFREAEWDEALDLVANKLKEIRERFGSDSIGFLTSARATNEENYIAQKFTRAVLGTNNIDHCARL